MNDIEFKISSLYQKYKNDRYSLLQEVFLLIKNEISYKFGDWRLDPQFVFKKKEGMCTTKSRCLFYVLSKLDFDVYYRVLRINARKVFGRFGIREIEKFLSNNSVHFYVVVKLDNEYINLDCSLDRDLENKLTYFNYAYNPNWNIKEDYVNFIDKKFIISISEPLKNIDNFFNKKVNFKNRIKFFISNTFLKYIRVCRIDEIKDGYLKKRLFLKWLRKDNIFEYFIIKFLILIQ